MQKQFISEELEEDMAGIIELITAIRNIRSEWNIDAKTEIDVVLSYNKAKYGDLLKELEAYIVKLCRLKSSRLGKKIKKPPYSAYAGPKIAEVYISLRGIINFEKEKERLAKKRDEVIRKLELVDKKLNNKDFLKKAPQSIIEKNRFSKKELESTLQRLDQNLRGITGNS
jgi:valyl-tRNA synthetase